MKRGMMQMNDQKQMSHKAGRPKDQRAIANEDDGFSAREMRRIEEGRRRERRRRGAVPHPGDGAARGDAPAPEAKGRTLSDRHPPPSPRPLENQNRTRPLSLLLSPLPSGGGGEEEEEGWISVLFYDYTPHSPRVGHPTRCGRWRAGPSSRQPTGPTTSPAG